MRIAYAKLGRSVLLDPSKWGAVGGDNEPLALLTTLAERNPDVEWVVAGRHGGDPVGLPANVFVPEVPRDEGQAKRVIQQWYTGADGAVIWLGQHGTSNTRIPQHDDPSKLTSPQQSFMRYAGPIISGLNSVNGRYEPVWLCADPRNYLKARDLKWYPTREILGQYDWMRTQRHHRFGDPAHPRDYVAGLAEAPQGLDPQAIATLSSEIDNGSWASDHYYCYSGLELTGVPRWEDEVDVPWHIRKRFGIVVNEARSYVKLDRPTIVRDWVTPLRPDFIYGKWSDAGQETAGLSIEPVHYTELRDALAQAKSTFTTPSSGSRWATAKPWECFALGVVCFFHPAYDDQGHIVPTLEQAAELSEHDVRRNLAAWLRVRDPRELELRVNAVERDEGTYAWLRDAQLELLRRARDEQRCVNLIEERLGLHG